MCDGMEEGCSIAHALHDHALLLHQYIHANGNPESSQSSQTFILVSPLYIDMAYTQEVAQGQLTCLPILSQKTPIMWMLNHKTVY